MPDRIDILSEAQTAVNERGERYGDAFTNLSITAYLWSDYLGMNLTAADVCNLMVLFKVSRALTGPTADTYADIAGYAALAGEFLETLSVDEQPDDQTQPEPVMDDDIPVRRLARVVDVNGDSQSLPITLEVE